MLGILRAEVERLGLRNVELVQGRWQDCGLLEADIVLASHVLYPLEDADAFLVRLDAATRRRCFVSLRALHLDALTDHLWRHFHAEPRRLPPTYLDAVNLLHELGILADVRILDTPQPWRYADLDTAVEEHLEQLILPDTPATRAELSSLLKDWLVADGDALRLPLTTMPIGVLSWGPAQHLEPLPARASVEP
jgi:hypothetical protein